MMTTIMMITPTILISKFIKTSNPMMFSIMVLTMSSMLFFSMYSLMGSAWMPTIYYLIFMGGILIIFMVLSSLMPNEQTKKFIKTPLILIILIASVLMNSAMSMSTNMLFIKQTKIMLKNSLTMEWMTMIILMYFFLFMIMMTMEKTSMRTTNCYKKK